ncbi:MAG: DEAD/DEAH box helicase [Rhodanobacter sp.]|nr:MAG: DEAD/DEAH box helicase [Rhodanobacter sp.]
MNPQPQATPSTHTDEARRMLMDTIRQLPLGAHFSRTTLKAAEVLAMHAQGWRKPLAWFQPEGSRADALQCELVEVQGSRRLVTVYVYPLFGQTALESRCSCDQPLCPHAAALLIRLQQLLDWPRAMTPLQRWQQGIGTIREPVPNAASIDCRESRQLVCLLDTDSDRQPARLVARLILIHGSDGLHQPQRWLSAEHARAHSHLSRQAMMWQAQLAIGQRRLRANEPGYVLEGHAGATLLGELLEAGICHHAQTLQPMAAGGLRQPAWQWSHDQHGQARIALAWPEAHAVRLLELDGLHYLDESSGELGKLALAPATWSMLEHMPPIPPAETGLIADWPPHPLLAGVPPPPAPPALREIKAGLQPVLVIGAARNAERGDHVLHLHAWADYGGCRLPLAGQPWREQVIVHQRGEYVQLRRAVEDEMGAARALAAADMVALVSLLPDARRTLQPAPDTQALGHRQHHRGGAETFAALEAIVQSLGSAGFRTEYDPELPFAVLPRETPLQATLVEGRQAGWTQFELAALLDGEEIDMLPIILDGLARRSFALTRSPHESADACWLAPIGTQRFLPLPLTRLREWLTPLVECLEAPGKRRGNRLDLSPAQAMALTDSLQQQGIALQGAHAASITEMLARLRAAQQSAPPALLPGSFQGTLRHYQQEGLQWLQALRQSGLGGVLADDMGLGKTVQIIAHLLLERESGRLNRPALIVAPTSLVFNWLDEIARFAPTLHCLNFTGPLRATQHEALQHAQVIVTSYALLANDLARLESIDYALLVLDEAQWIKNPLTQTARAVRRLRASHRIAVTGTPLENHLGELWAHLDAVMPGYLGDYRSFNRSFRIPIERHGDDARMAILRQRIAPFLLRRSKAAVAPELPPKTETVLRVAMDAGQRQLYESLRLAQSERVREALASYSAEQSRIVVLSALLRLRQVCCDPRLIEALDDPPASAKLDALLDLIHSLRDDGRQVLVFSQFTSMLALIAKALDAARFEYALLTGETGDRATPVRRFQSGEVTILLASLKAGGVGLNLTAADAVIHYDPWWNPAVEQQAVDRAHRIGRDQPIFVYKLLCDDTIEEKIESMKDHKSDLADALLEHAASPWAGFGDIDVRKLFDLPSPTR